MKRSRPRPLHSTPEASGSTALRQIALSYGVYIADTNTARRLGQPKFDLSSSLQEDRDDGVSEQLSRPLVLGGSLDFALQRIGIHILVV